MSFSFKTTTKIGTKIKCPFPFWHKLKYIAVYFLFLFAFKHCVHHFSHTLFYYFCIREWLLVPTQNPHYSKWALCCFLLLCYRCDKNPACSLIGRFQCLYLCCSYLWILRKCRFKIPMLRLIMLFQIGNLHHSYSLLAYKAHGSCAGWRQNECKFFSPFLLNCQFSLSTFLLVVKLEHAIFMQSWPLKQAKCHYANCSKDNSES